MKCSAQRKCHHCSEFYLPDRRNLHHQRYCSEPACRKQSKAESQRRWLQKPDNQTYFCGSQNSQRVKEWRKRHPGYWRKKKSAPQAPLQDLCTTQVAQNEGITKAEAPGALQEVWLMQPAVMVGLISTMTGSALQEDIAATTRALLRKGQDILGMRLGATTTRYHDENQTGTLSAAVAPCAAPV
jgi:hypothetical protein